MTQGNYTPGHWRLFEDAQGPCMVMHPTKEGVAIASLTDAFKPAGGFHDVQGWPEERNANARLIAAAPELFEALRALVRAVEERNEAAMTMHAGYSASVIDKAA